jgi:hypothetical protein
MYHDLPSGASFWSFLFVVDQDLAGEAREKGCPCGGRLHSADYPRKPKGTSAKLPELQCFRLSFCCDRDPPKADRKRSTPPSVRFLGRKVYLGVIVILISAMRQGPDPRRLRDLSGRFGADERTIARWQTFWRDHFPQTHFWKVARAHFMSLGENRRRNTPGGNQCAGREDMVAPGDRPQLHRRRRYHRTLVLHGAAPAR